MLRSEVVAPIARELELVTVADGFLQDADTLGVGKSHEAIGKNALKSLDERLVDHLIQELEIIAAVVESPTHTVLDEVLLEIHQLFLVYEGHFGLNHPELSQMARRITILGTESRSESVDGTEGRCSELAFKLSRDSERGLFTEEVVVVDDLSILVLAQVVKILRSYLEHVACSLAVARGNERCVEIEETMLMEIGVNGHCHVVTNAHDSTKCIGTQAHVGILTHHLKGLSFLLHRVVGTTKAENLDFGGIHLRCLPCSRTLDECSANSDARTSGDKFELFCIELSRIDNDLHVFDC